MSVTTKHGLISSRYIKAFAIGKGDPIAAVAYGEGQWPGSSAVLGLKSAVGAMSTSNTGAMVAAPSFIASDFLEFVRPRSLLDRIIGFRQVPLNTAVLKFSGDATGSVVAEGSAFPISKFDLSRISLPAKKVIAAVVVTDDLLRSSDPTAEASFGRELGRALGVALDRAAFDPDTAGSLTYGATSIASTGSSLAQIDADIKNLIAVFNNGDGALDTAVFAISAKTITYLSLLRGSGGALAYPGLSVRGGGVLAGIPVFVSGALTNDDSPPASSITLFDPAQVMVADNEQVDIRVARDAAIQMLTDPAAGATELVSLLQTNCVAIAAIRAIGFERASDTGVAVLTGLAY